MLLDQQHQADINGITPMPTDRVDDTSVVNTSSAETLVWQYNSSGAWAAAATQAAATMCYVKLTYSGVLNNQGSGIGCKDDTSFSLGASTRFDTHVKVPEEAFSKMESMTVANKVAYIATWITTNGYYAVDHRRGAVWGKAKATVANDAGTYKYATVLTGGGTGDKVDVIKIAGKTVAADDAAFTVGTSGMMPIGAFADETSPDSVNEGDNGIVRMTLERKLHIASTEAHDAAASSYASMGGYIAKNVDGSALPNAVGAENDIVRAAGTLSGVGLNMLVTEDGAATAMAVEDAAIGAASGDAVVMAGFETKDFDGAALPNATAEGDASRAAVTLNGVQMIMPVSEDGSWSPLDSSTQAMKAVEQAPIYTNNVGDTLATVTNETSATNYYYLDMAGYKYFMIQAETSDTTPTDTLTITIECSAQNDGTAQASCSFQDCTSALFGVASWVDTDFIAICDTPTQAKYVRVKTVTAGGANDADYTLYARRWY